MEFKLFKGNLNKFAKMSKFNKKNDIQKFNYLSTRVAIK